MTRMHDNPSERSGVRAIGVGLTLVLVLLVFISPVRASEPTWPKMTVKNGDTTSQGGLDWLIGYANAHRGTLDTIRAVIRYPGEDTANVASRELKDGFTLEHSVPLDDNTVTKQDEGPSLVTRFSLVDDGLDASHTDKTIWTLNVRFDLVMHKGRYAIKSVKVTDEGPVKDLYGLTVDPLIAAFDLVDPYAYDKTELDACRSFFGRSFGRWGRFNWPCRAATLITACPGQHALGCAETIARLSDGFSCCVFEYVENDKDKPDIPMYNTKDCQIGPHMGSKVVMVLSGCDDDFNCYIKAYTCSLHMDGQGAAHITWCANDRLLTFADSPHESNTCR